MKEQIYIILIINIKGTVGDIAFYLIFYTVGYGEKSHNFDL